jgi:hypothetical protein
MTKRSRPAKIRPKNQRAPDPSPAPLRPPDFGRHRRLCRICGHPKRREIEQAFLRGRSPEKLAEDYGLPDRSSIYRHVNATGHAERRRLSLRASLERILERSDKIKSSDFDIIRAASAYARLNNQGRWQEPAPQNIVVSVGDPADLSYVQNMDLPKLQAQATRIQSPTRESRK